MRWRGQRWVLGVLRPHSMRNAVSPLDTSHGCQRLPHEEWKGQLFSLLRHHYFFGKIGENPEVGLGDAAVSETLS